MTNSQLDTTNESQEVSPFPAGAYKAHINRRTQRHSKHNTEKKHKTFTKDTKMFPPPVASAAVRSEVVILFWWFIVCCGSYCVGSLFFSLLLIVLSSLLSSCWGIESWLLYLNYAVVWLSVFFVSSPLVSWVSLWYMLVAFLGHTHLFGALLSSSA